MSRRVSSSVSARPTPIQTNVDTAWDGGEDYENVATLDISGELRQAYFVERFHSNWKRRRMCPWRLEIDWRIRKQQKKWRPYKPYVDMPADYKTNIANLNLPLS